MKTEFTIINPDLGREYNQEKRMNLDEAMAVNDFIIWLKKHYVVAKIEKEKVIN